MAVYIYWTHLPDGDISSGIKQAHHKYSRADVYLILTLSIFYPLFGWIADGWIGRYRAILYGLYSLIIGCVLLTVSVIILDLDLLASEIFRWTSKVFNYFGISAIYANTLPFITDQMIAASADELTATIHWWFWSLTLLI